jgi:hypothetical protein
VIFTPTLKVGSLISNTIEDDPVTFFTKPTNPWSEITDMFLLIPLELPTSNVIVWENEEDVPLPITRAATTL